MMTAFAAVVLAVPPAAQGIPVGEDVLRTREAAALRAERAGRWGDVLSAYREILELLPETDARRALVRYSVTRALVSLDRRDEARAEIEALRPEGVLPVGLRAELLRLEACLDLREGQAARAARLLARSARLLETLPGSRNAIRALRAQLDRARCLRQAGQPRLALRVTDRALARFRSTGLPRPPFLEEALRGLLPGRRASTRERVRLAEFAATRGEWALAVDLLLAECWARRGRGDVAGARDVLERARRILARSGEPRLEPSVRLEEARLALVEGHDGEVRSRLERLRSEPGAVGAEASELVAVLAARSGPSLDAVAAWRAARTRYAALGDNLAAYRCGLRAGLELLELGRVHEALDEVRSGRRFRSMARSQTLRPELPLALARLAESVHLRLAAALRDDPDWRARFLLVEEARVGSLLSGPRRITEPLAALEAEGFARPRVLLEAQRDRPVEPVYDADEVLDLLRARLAARQGLLVLLPARAGGDAVLLTREGVWRHRPEDPRASREALRRYLALLGALPARGWWHGLWAAGRQAMRSALGPLARRLVELDSLLFVPGPELESLPAAAFLVGPYAPPEDESSLRFLGPDQGVAVRQLPSSLSILAEHRPPRRARGAWAVLPRENSLLEARADEARRLRALGVEVVEGSKIETETAPLLLLVGGHAEVVNGRARLRVGDRLVQPAAIVKSAPAAVVLSACATAAGVARPFSMRAGPARAFLRRGSRVVVVSAWPLVDRVAAQVDVALATGVLRRRSADPQGLAWDLQRIQTALRAETRWSAPFYWAPFLIFSRR